MIYFLSKEKDCLNTLYRTVSVLFLFIFWVYSVLDLIIIFYYNYLLP